MSGTAFSNIYRPDEGTFILVGDCYSDSTSRYLLSINNATANELIGLRIQSGVLYYTGVDGGSTQWDINAGAYTANAKVKIALSYKANAVSISVNGGAVISDTSATLPTPTQLELGSSLSGGWINGHIDRLTYYSVALPTYLQELSR